MPRTPISAELVKAVTKVLKMAPDDIPSAAKGADLVKRTLHNLAAIVGNIGELRTLYGSGHGQECKSERFCNRDMLGSSPEQHPHLSRFLWDTSEHKGH